MFKIDPSLAHAREISYSERRDLANRHTTKGSNVYRFHTLDGVLDRAALQRALRQLALRHEALRTHFEKAPSGEWVRRVETSSEIACAHTDLRAFPLDDEAVRQQVVAAAAAGFAPDAYPLARIDIFEVANEQSVMVVTVAALIADGQAVSLLIAELSELYRAERGGTPADLPELAFGLSAFVASQVAWMQSPAYRDRLQRLQDRLHGQLEETGGITQLHFSPETKESFLIDREFPCALGESLAQIARLAKVTVPTALMALIGLGFARERQESGFFFTSTFSNRSISGTANLVGYLSTTMPSFLRAALPGDEVECVKALHRELFLLMSQFSMIPISQIGPGIAERFPPPPAGTSIKFGKIVMDVNQSDFAQLLGLPSRPFAASMPTELGAHYKFVFRVARSGAVHLWLRGLKQRGSEELVRNVLDGQLPSVLTSIHH